MNGFRICHACKMPFLLKAENRYTANKRAGAFAVLVNGETLVDAFDCPHCGCQNVLGLRLESEMPTVPAATARVVCENYADYQEEAANE